MKHGATPENILYTLLHECHPSASQYPLSGPGKSTIEVLDSIAKRTGFYRRLTSLLSNYIIARKIEQGLDLPEINKKFYDQVWSSLSGKDNEWFSLRQEFILLCNFRTGEFPRDVKTRTKESVTNEMATREKNPR